MRRTSFIGALLVVAVSIQDCGPSIEVVHHYELRACPPATFELPSEVRSADRTVKRTGHSPTLPCPGWIQYELRKEGRLIGGGDVRLNRGPSCSVDIAWGYLAGGLFQKPRPEPEGERRVAALIDTLTAVLFANSELPPVIPATSVERLLTDEERKAWCARNPWSSARPEASFLCGA